MLREHCKDVMRGRFSYIKLVVVIWCVTWLALALLPLPGMLPHGFNTQWPAQMWGGFPLPQFYMGNIHPGSQVPVPKRGQQTPTANPSNPDACQEPSPKRVCLQRERFDEDLYDQACALLDTMSPLEKEKLRLYLGNCTHSPETGARQKDPEMCLHELFSQWVDVSTMDDDDVATVAETLCEVISKVLKSDALVVKLFVDLLEHALKNSKSSCKPQIQQLLSIASVQEEIVKAPAHLQPDAIANLPDHHPEKIKKWRELNKEMVRRVVALQTTETQKFWLREGVKPIAASSNERHVFFDMVRLVRLQCTKPEIKEFLAWFKNNVPSKFRKHEPASDKQGTLRHESGVFP